MNSRSFVTRGEILTLAGDIGEVTGGLKYELDTMASLYVEMGARIANLEKRVAELTAAKARETGREGGVAMLPLSLPSDDPLTKLWRFAVALDRRYERLERLLKKFIAALEARERPPQQPPLH